ncbi:ROK family protein [Sporosarcina sp. FSL K6-1522]|uniref:ROK family protein n=1 Tax=Sporosarcina sp. FSL K6-1522 TaxID=2921554 RepID=UPI00315AB5F3
MLGSIEAGGTKINCAVGHQDGTIVKQIQIATTTPDENVAQIVAFFQEHPVEAIGIGCFGPVNVDKESADYGSLLDTPKQQWRFYPFLATLKQQLAIPIELHSDVTVSGLGEVHLGGGKGDNFVLYVTIGTGIGGGVILNDQLLRSPRHPEMGHVTMQRVEGDQLVSVCPFHDNCFEGLASGPAIEKRWGKKGSELPPDHPAWEMEADYIAQGLLQMIVVLAPDRVIIGGGVMKQQQLLSRIREKVQEKLNGYTYYDRLENMEQLIITPVLGDDAGLIGGLLLADYANNM